MEPLSPDTRARIEAFCKKIAVAHSLDPEIQRELAAHIEDKMLGYLGGRERLTEADAFLLASERLGDPARLKELFGRVHAGEAAVTLGRKLMAIVILQTLARYAAIIIDAILVFAFVWLTSRPDGSFARYFFEFYANPILMFAQTTVLFGLVYWLLRRWKRRMAAGEAVWLMRWPVWLMLSLAVGLMALTPVSDIVKWRTTLLFKDFESRIFVFLVMLLTVAVADAVLWVWWCDSAPRRKGALLQAALWFAGWAFADTVLHQFIAPFPETTFSVSDGIEIARVNRWVLAWTHPSLANAQGLLTAIIVLLAMAGIGLGLYLFATSNADDQPRPTELG